MGVLLGSQRGRATGEEPISQGPPPTWAETFDANLELGQDRSGWNRDVAVREHYGRIAAALPDDTPFSFVVGSPFERDSDVYARGIWNRLQSVRARNPKFMPEVPADQAAFEAQIVAPIAAARQDNERTASRAEGFDGFVAGLGGGIAGSLSDPLNIALLPLGGGGKTIAQTVLRGALVNAVAEAATLPVASRELAKLGDSESASEMVQNVALAGFGGGLIDGLGRVLPGAVRGAASGVKGAQEAALAKIIPMLPEQLRPSIRTIDDIPDDVLADLAERTIGADNITPTQKAAITVARRNGEIAAINPFERDPAGVAAHLDGIEVALARILSNDPGAPVPSASRGTGVSAPARLRSGTAISSGGVGDARGAMKARIGVAENRTGSNTARPIDPETGKLLSSALGRYQFVTGTWDRLYRNRYGSQGLTPDQIAAKRHDPAIQEVLMDDLIDHNARQLHSIGAPETAGNLYLAHFLGAPKAKRVLTVDPATMLRDIDPRAVAANRFIKGIDNFTAQDLINWADRKMGGAGTADARAFSAPDGTDASATLARMMDANAADIARIEGELNAPRPPIVDDGDIVPVPVHEGEDIPVLAVPREAVEATERVGDVPPAISAPAPVLTPEMKAALDAYIANPKAGKIDVAVAARKLGIDRALVDRRFADAQGAFGSGSALVVRPVYKRQREILKNGKPGKRWIKVKVGERLQRPWKMNRDDRPMDLAEFLGALRDDEGHDLAKGMGLQRMIAGGGPFIRKNGRSLDDALEAATEAGYLHDPGFNSDTVQRQLTVADLIDALARNNAKDPADRVYSIHDEADVAAWIDKRRRQLGDDQADGRAWTAAQGYGLDLDPDELADMVEIARALDGDYELAAGEMLKARVAQTYEEMIDQTGDVDYRIDYDDDGTPILDRHDDAAEAWAGQGSDGPRPDARNAREGEADADAYRRADGESEQSGPIEADAYAAFDEPDGPGVTLQSDSIEHDLRAAVDPAIAERQRQQAALKAQAPMRSTAEQDGTMGSPLFDSVDQPGLDLGAANIRLNADGDAISLADGLAELDADAAAIKAVKDCL